MSPAACPPAILHEREVTKDIDDNEPTHTLIHLLTEPRQEIGERLIDSTRNLICLRNRRNAIILTQSRPHGLIRRAEVIFNELVVNFLALGMFGVFYILSRK